MRVFVMGGTGFIGRSIIERLLAEGHVVGGLARSEASATALQNVGVEAKLLKGGHQDPQLVAAVSGWDAVIDAATHNFGTGVAAVGAILRALGPGKIYIVTTGIYFHGDAPQPVDESQPFGLKARAPERWPEEGLKTMNAVAVSWTKFEASVLEGAAKGVRTCILRPSHVYGRGNAGIGGGILTTMRGAVKRGYHLFVDDGRQCVTPTVHVDDLAELYLLVLKTLASGALKAGSIVNGSCGNEPKQAVEEALAAACGGLPVKKLDVGEFEKKFGVPAAEAATQTCYINFSKARSLGWDPKCPSMFDELTKGSYAWPKVARKIGATVPSKL